jgi:peptidoglycan hydrolase FlgJ
MENLSQTQNPLELSRNTQDISGLDKLRRAAQSGDKDALQEAAQQFEAIFLQMMLKSMRKAEDVMADEDSPFNSDQAKFYRDMHDQQLATDLSSSGSLGLAKVIVQQLSLDKDGVTPASVIRNDGNLSDINRHRAHRVKQAQEAVLGANNPLANPAFKQAAFAGPEEFIQQLLPKAQEVAEQLGLDARAILAQAAVETGWGQQMIHKGDGQNSFNLFGIKADKRWQGDKAIVDTLEFKEGVAAKQKAPFKAYASFEEALQDYATFLQTNPRYSEALQTTEQPKAYFRALQQAGYATDPNYADKVISVLQGDALSKHAVVDNLNGEAK